MQNELQAINVLIQAAHIAQRKGAFTLPEADLVAQAVKMFSVEPKKEDEKPEEKKEDSPEQPA